MPHQNYSTDIAAAVAFAAIVSIVGKSSQLADNKDELTNTNVNLLLYGCGGGGGGYGASIAAAVAAESAAASLAGAEILLQINN